jgi:hypothetical protein
MPGTHDSPGDLLVSYAVDERGRLVGARAGDVAFALGEGYRVKKALHTPAVHARQTLVHVTLLLCPQWVIRRRRA